MPMRRIHHPRTRIASVPVRRLYSDLTTNVLGVYRTGGAGVSYTRSLANNLLTSTFIHVPNTSGILLNSTIACSVGTGTSVLRISGTLLSQRNTMRPRITQRVTVNATHLCDRPRCNSQVVNLSAANITNPNPSNSGPTKLICINLHVPTDLAASRTRILGTIRLRLSNVHRRIHHLAMFHILRGLDLFATDFGRWGHKAIILCVIRALGQP